MNQDQSLNISDLDKRTRDAIRELQDTIKARYPATTFELARGFEDPESIHISAIADVDDPDEVGDLVVERVVELLVDEGIAVHVIPLHTPERAQAAMEADSKRPGARRVGALRLLREPA
jgi:hypothetical protein